MGYNRSWKVPIHVVLNKLAKKHNLHSWLRNSIAYKKHIDVHNTFQGDLNAKIMNGIVSRDFMDRECNCYAPSKVDGKCMFNGDCRKCCVIYKATCTHCDMHYIGSTQNDVKKRISQHCRDVKNLVNRDINSDSFASHFAKHIDTDKTSLGQIRKLVKMEILWQGNPINCMKTFRKDTCSLCMKERCCILRNFKDNRMKLINSRSEIYGGCRHRTRFHKLDLNTTESNTSTDDGVNLERVNIKSVVQSIPKALTKLNNRICHTINGVASI